MTLSREHKGFTSLSALQGTSLWYAAGSSETVCLPIERKMLDTIAPNGEGGTRG